MERPDLLAHLADRILAAPLPHPTRVAVDGVDTAGKTSLCEELAGLLASHGRSVIRASIDRFHQPREVRYRLGPDSPAGYYADSFDLDALRQDLLLPLGPAGSRRMRTARFDFRANAAVESTPFDAPADSILLFDGVFLQRPEVAGCWDLVVFVQISFETMLARAQARDSDWMGGEAATRQRYETRYIPAQQRYLRECRPAERAGILIDNNDPLHPVLIRLE